MTNQEYADGLRQLAAFYEAHPETPQPYECEELGFNMTLEGRAGVEAVVRAFGGKWQKSESIFDLLYLHGAFGPFKLKVYVPKESVCERVQVGVKLVPATPERTLPAEPEREVPQYEWRCAGVLAEAEAR